MNDDNRRLSRPILILGAPRSGTTFLFELLRQDASLHGVPEPRLIWRWGNDGKSDMLGRSDARPEVIRHIRRSFAEEVRRNGKSRLLEKSPTNSLRLEFVLEVLPDARIIHIQRDARSAVLSMRRLWTGPGSGMPKVKLWRRIRESSPRQVPHYLAELAQRSLPRRWRGQPLWGPRLPGLRQWVREQGVLAACCLQWRLCVERACYVGRTLGPDRYLEVRLESLDLDEIERIAGFCELDSSPEMTSYFQQTFESRVRDPNPMGAAPEELDLIDLWTEPTEAWIRGSNRDDR